LDAVKEIEDKGMETQGWFAHIVPENPAIPEGINYHTHGCDVSFGFSDFQAVINVVPTQIHFIVRNLIEHVKTNKLQPKSGDMIQLDILTIPLLLLQAKEGNRKVLRVCVPDEQGNFQTSTVPLFAAQYKDL
jgi:hypothetical protein